MIRGKKWRRKSSQGKLKLYLHSIQIFSFSDLPSIVVEIKSGYFHCIKVPVALVFKSSKQNNLSKFLIYVTRCSSCCENQGNFPMPFFFSEKIDGNPSHRGYVPSGRHTLIGVASLVPSGVFGVTGSRLDQHPTHFLDRWMSLAT